MGDQVQHPLITSIQNLINPPEQLDKTWTYNGYIVSTVRTPDMGWETAICKEGGRWAPVERYGSREEAEAGHQRWVDAAHCSPTTVTDLGLPGHVEPREVEL